MSEVVISGRKKWYIVESRSVSEESVSELCSRPMRSDAMEFSMSPSRCSEPLFQTGQGSPQSGPVGFPWWRGCSLLWM